LSVAAIGTPSPTYQWYAGTSGTTSSPISGATSSSYTTPTLTNTTSYWLRASNMVGTADSNTVTISVVAYQPFTDDVLTAGSSVMRAVHITELRTRIDALRVRFGLTAFVWTDPTLNAGTTVIRAQQFIDTRTALAQVYIAAGLTPPTYTDPDLEIGATMKIVHVAELRAAVIAIE
jgi:hypothetical protein